MQFGNFIQDGLSGLITFSHEYFKEAVQSLLLSKYYLNLRKFVI
jgi:hypothetical protein